MRKALCGVAGIVLLYLSAPGLSCSVIIDRQPSMAERRVDARKAIEGASAIIDGEVVEAGGYGRPPALVYAHHVFKGPLGVRWFRIGTAGDDSCAIPLERTGQRLRMILIGGPEEYALFRDASRAREEDELLGSDRRKAYPYFAGPRPKADTPTHESAE